MRPTITEPDTPKPADAPATRRPRKWRRRVLIVAALSGLLAVLLHVPILTAAAQWMVVVEPISAGSDICIFGGDRSYDTAARLSHDDPDRRILLIASQPSRLAQLGIIESRAEAFQHQLADRGVPAEARNVMTIAGRGAWPTCEGVKQWLDENPQSSLTVLCAAYQSRRQRHILDDVLGDEQSRVSVVGLTDRRYDTDNWWQSRTGIRETLLSAITTADTIIRGRPSDAFEPAWDPDEHERSLARSLRRPNVEIDPPPETTDGWVDGMLTGIAAWLDVGSPPSHVEHVLILPGDEQVRPFVAAALINVGLAQDVLVPQNPLSPAQEDDIIAPTHEIIGDVLRLRGVSADRIILLPGVSTKTLDDARVARPLLNDDPHSRVAVVTSDYHTRRARLVIEHLYGEQSERFTYVSAPNDRFHAGDWWHSAGGTRQIVSEYIKLLAYWIQYGPGKYWLIVTLLLVMAVVVWRRRRKRTRSASDSSFPRSTT